MQKSLRELASDLREAGFEERDGKGSHRVFTHPSGASVSLPLNHPNRDGRGLVHTVRRLIQECHEMKRYRCPQCGSSAPVRFYALEALRGKLRCYECSQPGKPVYVVVEDDGAIQGHGVPAQKRKSA